MTIITIARQVGSGGHAVALALSERLGLRVIGRKELQEEALKRRLSLPESFVQFASEDGNAAPHHYLSYSELEFDLALRGGPHLAANDVATGFLTDITSQSRDILLTLQIVIYELAAQGNILLVGAGAQILLAELPHVLKVKIIAPEETRIRRMETAYSLGNDDARMAVIAGDREQVDYNRVIFGEDWHNPELWDIVINSESFTVEQIVDVIASASKTTAGIGNVSEHLMKAAAINRAFLDSPETGNSTACAIPRPAGIVLRGDVPNDELRAEILETTMRMSSGVSVTDSLVVHSLR